MKDTVDTSIKVHLTRKEADTIMQILANAPLAYTISHPLIQKFGQAVMDAQEKPASEPREHEE